MKVGEEGAGAIDSSREEVEDRDPDGGGSAHSRRVESVMIRASEDGASSEVPSWRSEVGRSPNPPNPLRLYPA